MKKKHAGGIKTNMVVTGRDQYWGWQIGLIIERKQKSS